MQNQAEAQAQGHTTGKRLTRELLTPAWHGDPWQTNSGATMSLARPAPPRWRPLTPFQLLL